MVCNSNPVTVPTIVNPIVVAYALNTTIGSLKTVRYASRLKSCGNRLNPFFMIALSDENDPDTIMINGTRHTRAIKPQKLYAMIFRMITSFPVFTLFAFLEDATFYPSS